MPKKANEEGASLINEHTDISARLSIVDEKSRVGD